MKVLISVDIEGIAGVFHPEQTRPGNGEYEQARRWMTGEVNVAALGALEGGASQVWINDSHGGFRNLVPDLLDSRVRVVLGKLRTLGMMAGLESSPEVVFTIDYHARAEPGGHSGAHDQQRCVRARYARCRRSRRGGALRQAPPKSAARASRS